jgi:hypothetical protein
MAAREESGKGEKPMKLKGQSQESTCMSNSLLGDSLIKEELNLASDEQLAAVLLNDYFSLRDRRPIPRYVVNVDYNKLYVYTIVYNYMSI